MKRLLAASLLLASTAAAQDRWDKYVGESASRLLGAGWVGTPVSLDAVKGNTVIVAFWNADVPC